MYLAGLLTYPVLPPSQPLRQWHCGVKHIALTVLKHGLTVAGTVPDPHRIPFYKRVDRLLLSPNRQQM